MKILNIIGKDNLKFTWFYKKNLMFKFSDILSSLKNK